MSRRVSFSCDSMAEDPMMFNKYAQNHYNKKRVAIGVWNIEIQSPEKTSSKRFSAEKFLKRVGAKVARALSFVSLKRSSRSKVSSSSLVRSRSYAESALALDSQRAEAVEDCIEFLNSSSCLQKSNSVS
ncbi:hypothetical protein DCAR_0521423 [Daucus carota subsp. sativus]|uniref:Josephin-like protein n=2 Tax=Daucus carota subsp. sativus TaxID=79200 RepID=A0A162A524_DAUCS|nr:PREDICTED: uncharacterized protein LOC108221719 [Daucus carota subsp. sativus]WOH02035.1 hypothetical protein DCAR_0521423 [Daucus carota subsp. sativus]